MTCWARAFRFGTDMLGRAIQLESMQLETRHLAVALLAGVMMVSPLAAGPVDTGTTHPDGTGGGVAEALSRAVTSPWLAPDAAKYQLRSARDIVIDTRRRTLMVFAVPAKHRKVVAILQRIFADPADKAAASLAPKIPPKATGPMATYKYQGEKVSNIIRDLAAEANMNLVIRGPEPRQTCDLSFKNVPTKDLLKLLLDIYNFNYQMSPNGETLVVFSGPTHRVMESYSVPPKVLVPLEEIAQALQSAILDVEEPYGPPVDDAVGGAGFVPEATPGSPGEAGTTLEIAPAGAPDVPPEPPPAPEPTPAVVPEAAGSAAPAPAPASPAPSPK